MDSDPLRPLPPSPADRAGTAPRGSPNVRSPTPAPSGPPTLSVTTLTPAVTVCYKPSEPLVPPLAGPAKPVEVSLWSAPMPARREPHASPAIRAFANELAARREMAGHTKVELAELLGYTPQFIGQLEACKNVPSRKVAEDLETFFKTDGVFPRLWENINETKHVAALPPGFADYLTRESQATELRIYSALLVVGLFQTERYAKTIIEGFGIGDTQNLAEKRLERKSVLDREDPPRIWLVLDEGVIRRTIGGPQVMAEQLRYLYELSRRPKCMVQIVPYRVGYHEGLGGDLTVLGFEDGSSVGYTESAGIGVLVEQPSGVADLAIRYDLLRGHALPVHESRMILKEAVESHERLETDRMAKKQP